MSEINILEIYLMGTGFAVLAMLIGWFLLIKESVGSGLIFISIGSIIGLLTVLIMIISIDKNFKALYLRVQYYTPTQHFRK